MAWLAPIELTKSEIFPANMRGIQADIENWTIDQLYDTIVVIGLLMFFRHQTALKLLTAVQDHVKPGGRAIVNLLIEGTTY